MNDKIKNFIKFYKKEDNRKSLIKGIIIGFIISVVLTGFSYQSLLKTSRTITEVSINPIKIIKYGLIDCGSYRVFQIGLFILITILVLILIQKKDTVKLGEEEDKISKESTELGSHHIATIEEQDKVLKCQKVEDCYDNIIGFRGPISSDMSANAEMAKKNAITILDGYDNPEIGPHWFLIGPPGSRKTSNFYIANIIQMIDRGESVIMTDPKGELRKMLYLYAKKQGCEVKELNLINPLLSDGINFLDYVDNNDDARMVRDVIMTGLAEKAQKKDFWEVGEGEWILCIILYLCETREVGDKERSLQGVHNFSLNNTLAEIDAMMEQLRDSSPAKNTWRSFKGDDKKTINESFRMGVANKLGAFNDIVLKQVTSVSGDINLRNPIKKQCVYFVLMSDTKTSNNFIANLFFSLLFTTNIEYADIHEKTKVPINIILEEFCNIGEIPDIRIKLATIRSRGMRCFLCIQGYQQLEDTYNAKVGGFLDQVDNQLVFGMNDNEKAKIISDKAGKGTLLIHQRSQTEHTFVPFEIHPEYGDRTTPTQADVLPIADILNMDRKKCILSLPGNEIIILNKFYWKWHPKASELVEEKYIYHTPKWWDEVLNDESLARDERELVEKELVKLNEIREIVRKEDALPDVKPAVRRETVYQEEVEVTVKTLAKYLKKKIEERKKPTVEEVIEKSITEEEVVIEEEKIILEEETNNLEIEEERKEELKEVLKDSTSESVIDEESVEEEEEEDLAEILRKRQEKKKEEAKKRQKYRKKSSI